MRPFRAVGGRKARRFRAMDSSGNPGPDRMDLLGISRIPYASHMGEPVVPYAREMVRQRVMTSRLSPLLLGCGLAAALLLSNACSVSAFDDASEQSSAASACGSENKA